MVNSKFPYVYKYGEGLENNHYAHPEKTEECRRYVLTVPDNGDYMALILGAISSLRSTKHYNPAALGYVPSQDFQKIIVDMLGSEGYVVPIKAGDIKMAAGKQPDTWLLCDGAVYSAVDYPVLFNAIGDTFGDGGGNTFRVPDMVGRFPMGTDLTVIGDTGGSATHQLTVDELPSHSHSVVEAFPSVTSVEPGVPQDMAVVNPTNTGLTGGNVAHNNLPPYLGVAYYIFTGIAECVPCEQIEPVFPSGMKQLASYFETSESEVIISEVNGDYTDYYITGQVLNAAFSGAVALFIRPNGINTASSYSHSRSVVNSSGIGGLHNSNRASLVHFNVPVEGVAIQLTFSRIHTNSYKWHYEATSYVSGDPVVWQGGGVISLGSSSLSDLRFSMDGENISLRGFRVYALPN